MEVTLEIPEPVAKTLGYARETLPRRALEALLVDECARGRLSRGKVAEILGLSFYEAEALFRSRRVPYPAKTSADDAWRMPRCPGPHDHRRRHRPGELPHPERAHRPRPTALRLARPPAGGPPRASSSQSASGRPTLGRDASCLGRSPSSLPPVGSSREFVRSLATPTHRKLEPLAAARFSDNRSGRFRRHYWSAAQSRGSV